MFEEEYYEPTFDEDIDNITESEFTKDELVLNVIKGGDLEEVIVGIEEIEKFINEYRVKCPA